MKRCAGTAPWTSAFVRFCWVLAKDMVENERNWRAITAVAEALLRRKRLEHDEVIEIILAARRPRNYRSLVIQDLTTE
jgi:hypothetical protein